MNNEKGFTLIELLVVISIISLLASVIFYTTSEAKLRGEDSRKIAQVVEARNSIELYRSSNNNAYPQSVSATTKGLYREGSTEYNEVMGRLVDSNTLSAIPRSSNQSDYYYEERDDGTGQFIAVLNSSKFQDEENGCVTSLLSGECSYDLESTDVEVCDESNECNNYDLSSGDTVMVPGTSGGGSQTASLCGPGHNRAHASYPSNHSDACSDGATIVSLSDEYNDDNKTQWLEWVCRDNSDSSNTENCSTIPESTTPAVCGSNTEIVMPSYFVFPSVSSIRTDAEDNYCSTGVYDTPLQIDNNTGQIRWTCYDDKWSSSISCYGQKEI